MGEKPQTKKLLLCAQLFQLLCLSAAASPIISRANENKYTVIIHQALEDFQDSGQMVAITSPRDGMRYKCWIPNEANTNEEDTELSSPSFTAQSLLEPLEGTCLYRVGGWWTYEMCYNEHVRQFHQEKDQPILPQDEFYLGVFVEGTSEGKEEKDYFSQLYIDGAVCDITGQKRETEVRYMCSGEKSSSVIVDVKEPFSCKYIIEVSTPLLCRHTLYQPPKENVQVINCALADEAELQRYKELQEKREQAVETLKWISESFDLYEEEDDEESSQTLRRKAGDLFEGGGGEEQEEMSSTTIPIQKRAQKKPNKEEEDLFSLEDDPLEVPLEDMLTELQKSEEGKEVLSHLKEALKRLKSVGDVQVQILHLDETLAEQEEAEDDKDKRRKNKF